MQGGRDAFSESAPAASTSHSLFVNKRSYKLNDEYNILCRKSRLYGSYLLCDLVYAMTRKRKLVLCFGLIIKAVHEKYNKISGTICKEVDNDTLLG